MPVDIRKPLKKLLPHLIKGQEDNLNEADTVQRIIKCLRTSSARPNDGDHLRDTGEEDLAKAIHGMLSTEVRERIGPPRVRRKARAKVRDPKPLLKGPTA